ncbi:MAG: ABC transporter permease [Lentisphaeria bacterium]
MNLLLGSLTIGLILGVLALGVYISFRIFNFADITVDGSITLGAAVAAVLLLRGWAPVPATLAAALAGGVAGAVTGILHAKFRIHGLLSGILVMTALYSVNLRIMGRSNLPLLSVTTLAERAEALGLACSGGRAAVWVWGWEVPVRDLMFLAFSAFGVALIAGLLYLFLNTRLGTAMRATGDNPQMICAQGVDTGLMIILGLGLSNALVAFSGAVLAQYQGFADVQMGIGMVVWGLASVIMGESLVRARRPGFMIVGAVFGAVLFRLLVAIALRFGMNPNDLKLITALFVLAALVLPGVADRVLKRTGGRAHA